MNNELKAFKGVVRNKYGSVVWSHKIQEKQAEIYSEKYILLSKINIGCSAIVGCGILSLFYTNWLWVKIFSAVVSFGSAFVSLYFKSFDLKGLSSGNKATALKLLVIRDELQLLLLKIKTEKWEYDDLYLEFENLVKRLDSIYQEAPDTTEKAVERARISLNVNKDNEITDEEIDGNLPEELRG